MPNEDNLYYFKDVTYCQIESGIMINTKPYLSVFEGNDISSMSEECVKKFHLDAAMMLDLLIKCKFAKIKVSV